ncbi:hypothetical protein LJR178_006773 [Variovorax sp. LjRoot178]
MNSTRQVSQVLVDDARNVDVVVIAPIHQGLEHSGAFSLLSAIRAAATGNASLLHCRITVGHACRDPAYVAAKHGNIITIAITPSTHYICLEAYASLSALASPASRNRGAGHTCSVEAR